MIHDDFRYMLRGKHLFGLAKEDCALLEPINQCGTGRDRALLLLHGFSSSPAVYRYLLPEIDHYDAIVCPVLQGHAESIQAFSLSTANDWRSTASKACEALLQSYKKVDVLGLSLGGLLACELSQKYPLNQLFLLAPALRLNINIDLVLKLARLMKYLGFDQLRNRAGDITSNSGAEISYRTLPISSIIEMLTLARNYQWQAPTCPVDVFLGANDRVVDSKEVEHLFAPLPNAKIHWLNNSAHVLPLDNDFKEIINCINA